MTETARRAPFEVPGVVPEWDLADRMTKALRVSGLSVNDVAAQLGVNRATVGRWINGHTKPKPAALWAWAALTGVDSGWLEEGCAIRDSNPEPAGLKHRAGRRHLRVVAA